MTLHVPLDRQERVNMEIRRAAAIEEGYRHHRRFLLRAGLLVMAWQLAGILLMGLSFHLTDPPYARLAFQLSFVVGYGGVFFSLVGIYVRGRERGEFE